VHFYVGAFFGVVSGFLLLSSNNSITGIVFNIDVKLFSFSVFPLPQ